jgi:hypothetical protein
MQLITAGDVQRLTGLTADQLREWTARRGLIEPDGKPNGPGSRARYSWRTVLLLRLAVVLKQVFHIELQSQRHVFVELARQLAGSSFPSLRGMALTLQSGGKFEIVPVATLQAIDEDLLIIRLDPHLDVISGSFRLTEPVRQLPLFPAVAVR